MAYTRVMAPASPFVNATVFTNGIACLNAQQVSFWVKAAGGGPLGAAAVTVWFRMSVNGGRKSDATIGAYAQFGRADNGTILVPGASDQGGVVVVVPNGTSAAPVYGLPFVECGLSLTMPAAAPPTGIEVWAQVLSGPGDSRVLTYPDAT